MSTYPPMKKVPRVTPTPLAMAQGQAESEHRLYERAEHGRKAAQKRILELEEIIRDARKLITAATPVELKKVLGRAGAVSNGYRDADRSKVDDA